MQSDLHIRFNDGEMMVHLDTFLPCSKGQLKRLMRLVMRDWEKTHVPPEFWCSGWVDVQGLLHDFHVALGGCLAV